MERCFQFLIFSVKPINKGMLRPYPFHKFSTQIKELSAEECHNQKTVKVAIIGVPNAGKSTFINNLINHRICPTSNKVHTTRKTNKAITTIHDNQIILFDTPGLVTSREMKKHHLESSFSSSYRHSIQHANMIGVIHDISNNWTRNNLHPTIINALQSYPKLPSFLVLNKVDILKSKRVLLELIKSLTNNKLSRKSKPHAAKKLVFNENPEIAQEYTEKETGWSYFSEVFMVSSITGDGLNDVMRFISSQGKPGKWEYSPDIFTDESPEDLIVDSVRARLLDYLPQEIPYKLQSRLEFYSIEKNTIYAAVQVACPNPRVERLICGESNGKLKQITERVTSDLVEMFGKPISLTIATFVPKSEQK